MTKAYRPMKVKFCPSPLYNNRCPLGGGVVRDAIKSIRINKDMWHSKPVGFTPTKITEEMKTQPVHGGRIVSQRTTLGKGTEYPFPPLVRENEAAPIPVTLEPAINSWDGGPKATIIDWKRKPVKPEPINPAHCRPVIMEPTEQSARAAILAKYAWIAQWEADPKKRMYKSTLQNARVNMAHELAELNSLNVTAELVNA